MRKRTTIVWDDSRPGMENFETRMRDLNLEMEANSILRKISSVERAEELVRKNPNIIGIVVSDTTRKFMRRSDKVRMMKMVLRTLSQTFRVPILYVGRSVPYKEARRAGADIKCPVGAVGLILQRV